MKSHLSGIALPMRQERERDREKESTLDRECENRRE